LASYSKHSGAWSARPERVLSESSIRSAAFLGINSGCGKQQDGDELEGRSGKENGVDTLKVAEVVVLARRLQCSWVRVAAALSTETERHQPHGTQDEQGSDSTHNEAPKCEVVAHFGLRLFQTLASYSKPSGAWSAPRSLIRPLRSLQVGEQRWIGWTPSVLYANRGLARTLCPRDAL